METQYFMHDGVRYIVSPDDITPDGKTVAEELGLTAEQYAAALAEWQATGAQE